MASLRELIDAKCKDCIYDGCSPGTWRQQTESCTSRSCPLWPERPVSTQTKVVERNTKVEDKKTVVASLPPAKPTPVVVPAPVVKNVAAPAPVAKPAPALAAKPPAKKGKPSMADLLAGLPDAKK